MASANVSSEDRLERERLFHDDRFESNPSRSSLLSSLTSEITLDALHNVYHTAKHYCQGGKVLDYGCAQGEATILLRSKFGAASVEGIDISPVAVQQASERAAAVGVDEVNFQVMDAESLEFEKRSFDLVFGIGILHHLDMQRSCEEIRRVLKPTGAAVFLEPLAHNPFINCVRWVTPKLRTPDEHPLRISDVRSLAKHFGVIEHQFVNLCTLLSAPLGSSPAARLVRRMLATTDVALFKTLPFSRRFAWNVVLTLREPKGS